jgi:polygalacturonase
MQKPSLGLLLLCPLLCAAGTGRPVFNIADYGAKQDGSAPATEAFRSAIQAAKAAGGGTIYVPAGKYQSGPIELFSNMTLEIDTGATIEFPVAPLPFTKGRYLGVEALVPMPLIGGHDVENVAVTGRGVLTTADYEAWRKAYFDAYQEYLKSRQGLVSTHGDDSGSANGPNWDHLLSALEAKRPVSEEEYRKAAGELRPSFLCFMNAKNVLVEGVRFVGAPMFVVHLLYTENAVVRNIMVESYPGPHANGIVVDSSRFVRISDCYIDTGDDGIVLKAGKDADGLRVNRPTEDVTITNCTVHRAHGAVVIGSETAGSIRNVAASNITAVDTEVGIRLKSRRGRGGVVEDARFDNWTMRNVGEGIVVTSYYVMGGEKQTAVEPVSERTPVFRNIAISHVTVNGAKKKVATIDGLPEMPIRGLRLTDVVGSGQAGLTARYTDGLELRGVRINARLGPAFAIESASNLEFDEPAAPAATVPVRNDRVAVSDETIRPGEAVKWNGEHPSVLVYFTDGSAEETRGAGEPARITVRRGQSVFVPAKPVMMKNTGSADLHLARIEFLGKGLAETWGAAGLSPNYKMLFENEYARVYDIRIAAGTNEPQHTHRDRVVVCLSGAQLEHLMPDGRREPSTLHDGEIVWRRGGTHIGQNLGKTDLWVIAVEPK